MNDQNSNKELSEVKPIHRCWYCGGELIWQSDFDLFDVYPELDGEFKGGIVTYLVCSECGADVEYTIKDSIEDEK